MELIVATHNLGKLEEMRRGLREAAPTVRLRPVTDFLSSLPDAPAENGSTYLENALIKATFYADLLGRPVIADDGGLELTAFPNLLGLHTSRFFKGESDRAKNQEILSLFENTAASRKAHLHACLVYYRSSEDFLTAEGTLTGEIVSEKGEMGYGFDRIFWLPTEKKTLAQLPQSQRDGYSPRVQALLALIEQLRGEEHG
ncbi:non-canonical purine NTP pyrophosphatase [Enterococcus sp. AD013-P3]|uniref:non-canonical purine NTP pyrophosphatase n=1 Tax=Enterococcus sp. AD013-P3 TaxID=3411036 RepID=UPI003B944FBF